MILGSGRKGLTGIQGQCRVLTMSFLQEEMDTAMQRYQPAVVGNVVKTFHSVEGSMCHSVPSSSEFQTRYSHDRNLGWRQPGLFVAPEGEH